MTDYAIADLDGTVSDCSWRRLYATDAKLEPDPAKKADRWDEFHSLSYKDEPHVGEVLLLQAWAKAGGKIIYITGRSHRFRAMTQTWLTLNGLPTTPLFMRSRGDLGRTADYKLRIMHLIQRNVLKPGDRIAFILEDKQAVVDMWRAHGFTCLQPRVENF
jgi:hypothetical protein